jgi:ligand-binding SRPBCC domain-containing protein
MQYHLTFSTHLAASPATVWDWMTSFAGISREMAPYLHMSKPSGVTDLRSVGFKPGQAMFRSWISLFHLIPFDYSDLTLISLEEGVGFVEQSPMRIWRYSRQLRPAADGGCVLTDELTFDPRIAGWLSCRIVRAFFSHRHRMLARYLGTST